MITREELIRSKEYWLVQIQNRLYEEVNNYLASESLTKSDFANKLNVSKGYVSQILNGDFDHKLSKLVELSLAIEKVPIIQFENIDNCYKLDKLGLLDILHNKSVKIVNKPLKKRENSHIGKYLKNKEFITGYNEMGYYTPNITNVLPNFI